MELKHRILIGTAALALLTTPAMAQEYTWHSATKLQLSGALGFAAKLAGGGKEVIETSYLSGHKLRTEQGDNATIIDADAGSFTVINNKNKTYSTMTFEELAEVMRQAEAKMTKTAQSEKKSSDPKASDSEVKFKYSAKLDATGEQANIAGYTAKRTFVTVTIDVTARPEDEKEMQEAGSIVILADTWNTDAAPHARAVKSFHEAYARKAAREFGSTRGLEAVFSAHPGAKEAFETAGKEMKKVPGVSARSVLYMVIVPPDKKFDRELALAGNKKPEDKASEEGGAGKKLGGLLGKLKPKAETSEEKSEKDAQQGTLLTVTTELRDVQAGGVPSGAFTVPAGYKEQKLRN